MRKSRMAALGGIAVAALAISLHTLSPPARAQFDAFQILQWLEAWQGSVSAGGAPRINATSGNVAAGVATATIAAVAGKLNYITGWDVDGGGATAASVVDCTVTGLAGGTEHRSLPVPATVTVGLTPIRVRYPHPLPASAVNVAIVASCPSLGAGNTNTTVNLYGFTGQN